MLLALLLKSSNLYFPLQWVISALISQTIKDVLLISACLDPNSILDIKVKSVITKIMLICFEYDFKKSRL